MSVIPIQMYGGAMKLHKSKSGQDGEEESSRRWDAQSQTKCPDFVQHELNFLGPLLSFSEILHLT